ncbi:Aldolase-type TIM barrel, partial [Penicillium expansum]
MESLRVCDRSEVAEHKSLQSCWVIIDQIVYDLTSFVELHPGGSKIILRYAGKTLVGHLKAFILMIRCQSISKLSERYHIIDIVGKVDTPTPIPKMTVQTPNTKESNGELPTPSPTPKLRLRNILNMSDFEVAASQRLSPKAFAFFKAGAEDEKTEQWNRNSWQLARFRPRILRPVESVDLSTTILGTKVSVPFFIGPAGGGKLAHPAGEVLMTQAAAKNGVLHWVCNMAGCTQEEMACARAPNQTTYWQIYAKTDLEVTEKEIRRAIELGYKGFALTVDAIRGGKRERDLRMEAAEYEASHPDEPEDDEDDTPTTGGISAQRGAVCSSFDWDSAITWLRGLTDLPIAIKGIQCWEDAALCMKYGAHPWLSNHGGRQLEGAPSAIETLIEIRQNAPEVFDNCEVIVDGGIMRGGDVVKAIALGAKGGGSRACIL